MRNNFLLDADETILDFVRSSRESLRYAMETIGLTWREGDFSAYKEINDGLWREYERGEITKKALTRERFVRFFAHLNVEADPSQANAIYFDKLSRTGYLLEGAQEFLNALKKRGKIFLITNGTPQAKYGRLDSLNLRSFFDGIYVSDEIGFAKPDVRFFEFLLKREHLLKDDCLVIGDSLSSDIAGANASGISCIWYDPFHREMKGSVADYCAQTYDDILKIIDTLNG